MNLTILALHTLHLSNSPFLASISNLRISKCSFTYFTSPIAYNSNLKIFDTKFNNGLSSVLITETVEYTEPVVYSFENDSYIEVRHSTFSNINAGASPVITVNSGNNFTMTENLMTRCFTESELGVIVLDPLYYVSIDSFCQYSCFSNGASLVYCKNSRSATFSLVTSMDISSSFCEVPVWSVGGSLTFQNVNFTALSELRYGCIKAVDTSINAKYFWVENTYSNGFISVSSMSSANLSYCNFISNIVDNSYIDVEDSQLNIYYSNFRSVYTYIFFEIEMNYNLANVSINECRFECPRSNVVVDNVIETGCVFNATDFELFNVTFLSYELCVGNVTNENISFFHLEYDEFVISIFIGVAILLTVLNLIYSGIHRTKKKAKKEESDYQNELNQAEILEKKAKKRQRRMEKKAIMDSTNI